MGMELEIYGIESIPEKDMQEQKSQYLKRYAPYDARCATSDAWNSFSYARLTTRMMPIAGMMPPQAQDAPL
ncbi:hypothetical protein MHYP_G00355740 [Metynnis hypsauchen]